MIFKKEQTTLESRLKPAMKLIKNLDRVEFDMLIQSMMSLYEGIEKLRVVDTWAVANPYSVEDKPTDDIDMADEVLKREAKKTRKKNGKVEK